MSHSLFTIIGPVMIGPSSSHTAGAARLGKVARGLFGVLPEEVDIVLYGSFGEVYHGHGTDSALVGGVLGFSPHDERIKHSFSIAKQQGMKVRIIPKPEMGNTYHPNSAEFLLQSNSGSKKRKMRIVGSSIGGGMIKIVEIDDMEVSLSGEHDIVIFSANSEYNGLHIIDSVLQENAVEVLQLFSKEKQTDSSVIRYIVEINHVPEQLEELLEQHPAVSRVSVIPHITMWEGIHDENIPPLL